MYPQMFFSSHYGLNLYFCPVSASLSSDEELHNLIYCIFQNVTSRQWFPHLGTGTKVNPAISPTVLRFTQQITSTFLVNWAQKPQFGSYNIWAFQASNSIYCSFGALRYFCYIFFKMQQLELTRRSKTRIAPSIDRKLRMILHSLLDIFWPILGSEQIFLLQHVHIFN